MIELVRTRRSIRTYSAEPVSSESLALLVETVLRAPSSRNNKPWEFIIVDDRELLAGLSQAKSSGSHFLKGAALGIVICADSSKSDVWIEDCSIAAILAQMTAHSLGLGSCWIQIRSRMQNEAVSSEQYVRGLLSVPPHFNIAAIISIGHPAEAKKPVPEDRLDFGKVRHNGFGNFFGAKTEGQFFAASISRRTRPAFS